MDNMNNRLWNCKNPYQGQYRKVLCVCSAGLLRSPTAAVVLSQEPFNYNTRAAGIDKDHALIPVDKVLLSWADEIVCMTEEQTNWVQLETQYYELEDREVVCLNIPDSYGYRDPELMELIKINYSGQFG